MDPLLERFERILRSLFQEGRPEDDWAHISEESDFQDAWDELDEFLKSGSASTGRSSGYEDFFQGASSSSAGPRSYQDRMPPESLRKDYTELGVSFGAPFEEVRISYRRLMRRHHPDLHAGDPKRHAEATQKAQQLNVSFQRIRAWEMAKQG